jgi:anti-sigma-K factor RskA
MMTTTPDVHMLTGAYVLNALPEDERIGFEAHLDDCQSCRAEVAELREASTRLGRAVAEPPPADLKARVMTAATGTRQLPPLVRPDGTKPVDRSISRRSLFALAASAAAVVGTGGLAYDQYRQNRQTQRENEQLAAILAEPDVRTVRGEVSGGGQATVVMSPRRDAAVVLLHGLRRLPDERTYQLWLMDKSETMHSAGLASGQTSDQTRLIEGGVADKIKFGLTVERKGGATRPTLPPVALIDMA